MLGTESMSYRVTSHDSGKRLDHMIRTSFGGVSRAQAKLLIASGAVRVDGKPTRKGLQVQVGQIITLSEPPKPADFEPLADVDAELDVVYEDADCVVVNKSAGTPIHPLEASERGTLANALAARYPEMSGIGYTRRESGLLHRIDNDTSGVVVAARTADAFKCLREQLASGSWTKRYQALVAGEPPLGDICASLVSTGTSRVSVKAAGKPSKSPTCILRVEPFDGFSLVEVEVRSAFRHQVRAHLSHIGYPLLGDTLYGGPQVAGLRRHALHASSVVFDSPSGGTCVTVTSPMPADMVAACARTALSLVDIDGDSDDQ